MKYPELGQKLKSARQAAGFKTIASFAKALSNVGPAYTDDAIRLWEKGDRRPPRETLLSISALLVKHGVFKTRRQIDDLLSSAGMSALTENEQETNLPHLPQGQSDNLPDKPPYRTLIGREQALDELMKHLKTPAIKQFIVISGLGGIGKTALTYELVQQAMATGLFQKLIWETAKSEEFTGITTVKRRQIINEQALLLSYARQLGLNLEVGTSVSRLETELRRALRLASTLIVLDNMETLETTRSIARILYGLVSPGESQVIVTSRERLAEESFVLDYPLQGLSEVASLELLKDEALNRGANTLLLADPLLLKRIYTVTGGMPLAIKLIVSQYLLGIALDEELSRLQETTTEEELYHFIYFDIWQKLSLLSQRTLVGLATFSAPALRSMLLIVSEINEHEFNSIVPELIKASLLEMSHQPIVSQQRYDIHSMTRWFINGPLTDMWNEQNSSGIS